METHSIRILIDGVEYVATPTKEVKPERIEVGNVWFASDKPDGGALWAFDTNQQVHPSKLTLVKQAIERVLNDDGSTYSPFSNFTIDYDGITVTANGEQYVSKKAVDKVREDAFNAARLQHPMAGYKYNTFANYYNDLQR